MPIGNVSEFKPESDDWATYKTRLTSWLVVNDIGDDDKKRAALIAILGGDAVQLLASLCSPDKLEDKTFDQLVKFLDDHFGRRNEVAEAYVFDTRNQSQSESISDFVLALKKLSTHCNFGPTAQLKQKLRNRLVAGVRSDTIRQALIREGPNLTWDSAVTLATQMDDYQSSAMARQSATTVEVNAVQRGGPAANRSQGSSNSAPNLGPHSTKAKYSVSRSRCWRCGKNNHGPEFCRFKEATCHACGSAGHIKPMCRERPRAQANVVDHTRENDNFDSLTVANTLVVANSYASNPYTVHVSVNDVNLKMEIDTGASISLIPYLVYQRYFRNVKLFKSDVNFCSFTGDVVKCNGKMLVTVRHHNQTSRLWLHVLEASHYTLLGRDWLRELHMDWQSIKSVSKASVSGLDKLLSEYSSIFKGQGLLKGSPAKLELIEGAIPKRSKPYRVPIALQSTVDKELDRLISEGILEPVEHSDWATSLMFVPKSDGSVRPCGDFKSTVNPMLKDVAPPQINMDDILCDLAGNKFFSNLDFAQAYNQMAIDEKSRELLTLVTHRGLVQYTRLPFGIKTAPSLWQRAVERVLGDIKGIHIYYDDILVAGRTVEEHNHRLETVFKRVAEHGLKLKLSKCSFLKSEVNYLGHIIDEHGTRPLPAKIDSILQTETPRDKSKVRSYLGLLNFYRRYLPNLAAVVAPMSALLKDHVKFEWTKDAEYSFEKSKEVIRTSDLLVHYDPNIPVKLTCDASRVGIAAVMSHTIDGVDRPIQFASQKLTSAQTLYPQIEREGLAIVFGLDKFRHYLYGRHFVLVTDNQALSKIFAPNKGLPVMTAERIQRWALKLSAYNYSVEWRRSADNEADFLSRYPSGEGNVDLGEEGCAFVFKLDGLRLPITSSQVSRATCRDRLLSRVLRLVNEGWPNELCAADSELCSFFTRKTELSVMSGVVMWGNRVVVPQSLQSEVLQELHVGHLGMSKMKSVARSCVWWPGLDKAIEGACRACDSCMSTSNDPTVANHHPWLPTSRPYQRIHIDYAGPIEGGHMLLVIVDSFTKWPEVCITKSTSSYSTINLLRPIFARWGIPEELVSDNGPQFCSTEFGAFTAHLGIRHKRGAPYHPATNGLAERFVQTVKKGLKAASSEGSDLHYRLSQFLMAYRNAPHSTTGQSPAQLMLGRPLRSRLDSVKPEFVSKQLEIAQNTQIRDMEIGANVWVRCYLGAVKWKQGIVLDKIGPLCYYVEVEGKKWKRHIDQLKSRRPDFDLPVEIETTLNGSVPILGQLPNAMFYRNLPREPCSQPASQPVSAPQQNVAAPRVRHELPVTSSTVSSNLDFIIPEHCATSPALRRSTRVRKAPERLDL